MNRNELIGRVAAQHIKAEIDAEDRGALRFCIIGMDPLAADIAASVLQDPDLARIVEVRIPDHLPGADSLPHHAVSQEAAAHWRNRPLSPGSRAILFAVSNDEMQRIGKTAETLPKLDTDKLRRLYDVWIDAAGLSGDALQEKERQWLRVALEAINDTHTARTLEAFADFVLSAAEQIQDGVRVELALDAALPALHLPANAAAFNEISDAKKATPGEWGKRLRRINAKVRPLLVRENDKGERIDEQIRENLNEICESLDAAEVSTIKEFLEADLSPDHWMDVQARLVSCDWNRIKDVFEGARKKSAPLGEATVNFFEEEFPGTLDDDWEEYLTSSLSPAPKDPTEEAVEFYETHKESIAHNSALQRQWEKYIYRNPKTYDDFLVGLLETLQHLRSGARGLDVSETPNLLIRIPNADKKSFWRNKNPHIVRHFAWRHHGIQSAFGDRVTFDFGKLYEYYLETFDEDLARITKRGKDARSLKFEVTLDPEGASEKMIFYWSMSDQDVATALPEDLRRLANLGRDRALFATANIARQAVSAKGHIQRVSLDDKNTLRDVDNDSKGALVAPNRADGDLYERMSQELDKLARDGLITSAQRGQIQTALAKFRDRYTSAVRHWADPDKPGIGSPAMREQAEAYGELLGALIAHAPADLARETLWTRTLRIGVANVGGGTNAAIVTPWQPLRMLELHLKVLQTARLIVAVLDSGDDDIQRADLFFDQRARELRSVYYPEVCIGIGEERPELLAVTQSGNGYSLAELPQRTENDVDNTLDVDPTVAAKAFASIGEQYLSLLPHEKSNFSVALYNSDSKALPKAIADALSGQVEQEDSLRCDLLLTHSDPMRMRQTYEQQNMAVADTGSAALSSEAAKNFLSRLRVGFLDHSEIDDDDAARAVDLVLLQDVVSRNAELVWKESPSDEEPPLQAHVPARWSRRRPVARGETSSAVYLTAPVQPKASQNYLNALQGVTSGTDTGFQNVIPAREISYRDTGVGETFKETHRIGEWVVNFDELVDRRLLEQKDISVIRHIHDRDVDRNIVVSTTSEPTLLRALLDSRLQAIDPTMDDATRGETCQRLIREANKLSGQVIMRAARFGRYANELIGVVLSMQRIKQGLGHDSDRHIGWFFLDDFASWFGQKEEQIADIMAISPIVENGRPVLRIAITEAKFVTADGHQKHKKSSARQLSETVGRLSRALAPDLDRIDREAWLNRIGDLMLEAMEPFDDAPVNGWNLQQWSWEVRQDNVPIKVVGFSHVFIHDDAAPVDAGDAVPLSKMPHCWQVTVDRAGVRDDIRQFANLAPDGPQAATPAEREGWESALVSTQHGAEEGPSQGTQTDPETTGTTEGGADPSPADETPSDDQTTETTGSDGEQGSPRLPEDDAQGETEDSEEQETTEQKPRDSHAPQDAVTCRWPSEDLRRWILAGSDQGFATPEDEAWLEGVAKRLQRALRGYGMSAELRGTNLTPNAALVRFKGSDDLTIDKVERKRRELYTSHEVDVINVLPAPGEVIVMVSRQHRAKLRMQDLWRQRRLPPEAPDRNLSLLLGAKEEDGKLLYLNLSEEFEGRPQHGPHTLIAGETGSGKGVLVQNLLLDICATNAPESAEIRLIDPKAGVDYPWMKRMPHLKGDLITEQDAAIETFENLVAEMERRNKLLASKGVTKIAQYNRRVDPSERLPIIFLFHDELADWMLLPEYRDAVSTNVVRLGVKARAAGIHLVLVTQRPDKDALPMQLRANCSNRLVLKVADKRNSELVLDEAGAERLLGSGHLAAKLSGEGKIVLAQVPFIHEDEAVEVGNMIADAWQGASAA